MAHKYNSNIIFCYLEQCETVVSSMCTPRYSPLMSANVSYYRLFMWLYAAALRRASFLMVNSSWTKNHIDSILSHKDVFLDMLMWTAGLPWNIMWAFSDSHVSPKTAQIVYPPCETGELKYFPLSNRERVILSVAQFRFVILSLSLRM
jgi:alpha-1,2-mannosyltransferase